MILNARRLEPGLEVVMVEGFPSFGTKACDHRRQQHSWFGCRAGSDVSSIFYHGFCYGKFDDQPVEDAQRLAFAARGGGGGLPYITDGNARRKFQKKPLKVTILGVAPANFIP